MTEVPNVSLVMRELSGLSSQVDSLLRKTNATVGPTDARSIGQQIQQFDRMATSSRADRHRQLMERMKGSVGGAKALIGGSTPREEQYTPPVEASTSYYEQGTTGSRFVMPKIKYRHLGEGNRQPAEAQSQLRNTRSSLQREFYEADERRQFGTQYEDSQPPYLSNTEAKFSRTGKGIDEEQPQEDVLQRYYDICTRRRKNVASSVIEGVQPKGDPERFTRFRESSNEAGINRAMKTLMDRR